MIRSIPALALSIALLSGCNPPRPAATTTDSSDSISTSRTEDSRPKTPSDPTPTAPTTPAVPSPSAPAVEADDKIVPFDLAPLGIDALIDVPKNAKTEWRYDWLQISASTKSTLTVGFGTFDFAKKKKQYQDDQYGTFKRIIVDTADTLVVETDRQGRVFHMHVNVKCGEETYYISHTDWLMSEKEAEICVRAAKSLRQTEAHKKSEAEVVAALAALRKAYAKIDRKFGRYKIALRGEDATDAAVAEAGKVPHIEKLVLRNAGQITPTGLGGLAKAKDLEMVSFQGVETTDAQLVSMKLLTNVRGFHFSKTSLTGAGLVHLAGLTQLESLDVAGHEIDDASLIHLKGLKALSWLDLGGTPVTDAGLERLKGLTKMADLRLNETKITDAGLIHLGAFPALKVLDLGGTSVTDAGFERLKPLTKLTDLFLRETKMTDAGLAILKNLPDLETVDLTGNKSITDAGLVHLKGMAKLKKVVLTKTGITKPAVTELKAARPGLEIEME